MVSAGSMANGAEREETRRDGVRVVRAGRAPRDVWAVVVLGLGAVLALFLLRSGESAPPTASPPRPAPDVAGTPPPSEPGAVARDPAQAAPAVPRSRGAQLRALRAMGVEPHRGPDGHRELDAGPVIDALHAAGVHDGIAAFPPPGTDPPKSGVIVPDDVVLPEGYVRHHQSTDDGQELPPILMFHPDYEFYDEQGRKIDVPPDRIVPPELVPPGFPVRMLEVPAPKQR